MIMANPAQTIPSTRAEKERGVPSPGRVQALAKLENINIPKFAKKNQETEDRSRGDICGCWDLCRS